MKTIHITSQDELPDVAEAVIEALGRRTVVALRGEMGAGKTTLIREIAAELGAADTVTSPTFAIVNQYKGEGNRRIHHFDFYRINDLRNESHGGRLTDMSAGFGSLSNDSISAAALHKLRKSHRSNNRNYFHSCFLPHFHIFSRTSGSSRHDLDTFFHNYFRNISRIRAHKHNIHSKWFVRQLACCPYLLAHPLCRSTGGTNKSKTTCF